MEERTYSMTSAVRPCRHYCLSFAAACATLPNVWCLSFEWLQMHCAASFFHSLTSKLQ